MVKKILQFDDDTFLGKMYQVKFKQNNFEHIWKEHPETDKADKFVKYILEINPDLIIMDIIMPVMDGYKATKILMKDKRTKNIPIFMLTNLSQEEDIIKGKELGVTDYFVTANHIPSEFIAKIKEYFEDPINYKPKFG
ncbi:MAG: response regulator [Candidatus Komeilibacteria bacterium]|jgi:DNA-binding response OmpR family regulator|nr:response regulator [Candidatus Komeilibacteria bacterium]MBT4447751.1 response regulator [Candidatus Komeilibacteria bacterium]